VPATAERFDVVVVGGRCAGAPLAAMLAREGVKVALVEKVEFPRDTLSTHNFQADALAFLDRLGVTGRLRATCAPFVNRVDGRAGDFHWSVDWPLRPGDPGGVACIRRFVLDPILADAAAEAGAEVRMRTTVRALLEERGRVVGVRTEANGGGTELRARLVVGADGRSSTVASLCGARRYNLTPNRRFAYWAFFEGAAGGPEPTFVLHRFDDRFVIANQADDGLYMVILFPDLAELGRFRANLETSFMEHALSCAPVASALAHARRVGKFQGMLRWTGYFREASGPGWVLAGDAAHFKDPCAGRGIADAFLQVGALVPAIVSGLAGSDDDLDRAMTGWGRWRDGAFAEHHWLARDLGKAGQVPAVLPEILRGLDRRGRLDQFMDLFAHRAQPSQVLTPPRLLGATGRLLRTRGAGRRRVLGEVGTLIADDVRDRRRTRRPAYESAAADDG
jgi:flavin-dependent dehydrogenase